MCPLRAAFARVKVGGSMRVAVVAAARLNGTWQIYRFPNGDANLTRSHAERSLFELGGILLLYGLQRYIGTYPTLSCGFFFFFFVFSSSSGSILFLRRYSLFFFTPVTRGYCIFAEIPPAVSRTRAHRPSAYMILL